MAARDTFAELTKKVDYETQEEGDGEKGVLAAVFDLFITAKTSGLQVASC